MHAHAVADVQKALAHAADPPRHPAPQEKDHSERQHPAEEELAQPVVVAAHAVDHALRGELLGEFLVPQRHGVEAPRLARARCRGGERAGDAGIGDHDLGHFTPLDVRHEFAVGDLAASDLGRLLPELEGDDDEDEIQNECELGMLPETLARGLVDLDIGLVIGSAVAGTLHTRDLTRLRAGTDVRRWRRALKPSRAPSRGPSHRGYRSGGAVRESTPPCSPCRQAP